MPISNSVASVLARHQHGRPLFSARLNESEAAAIRSALEAEVRVHGIEVLGNAALCPAFLFYAAHFLGQRADRLAWAPILASLGVLASECSRYPVLYDAMEGGLGRLGRRLRRSAGERRFLGTLLRESGLPVAIGDLGTRIREKVLDVGWESISDETSCQSIAQEIAQESDGSLRSVLDGEDGVAALAGFLADAYEVRFALAARGVDLSTLRNADDVRAELARLEIEPPLVRSEQLLADVLNAFLAPTAPSKPPLPHCRLVVRRGASGAGLFVRVDLAVLDRCEELRELSLVALSARPSDGSAYLAERDATRSFRETRTGAQYVEWRRRPGAGPTVVDARARDAVGGARVVALATMEWPQDDLLWFDAAGELLSETHESVSVGEQFVVLVQTDAVLVGEGEVVVTALGSVAGLQGFDVDVRGTGTLAIIGADGSSQRIPSSSSALRVEVFPVTPVAGLLSARVHGRLPTIVLPDGIEANLAVAGFGGERAPMGLVRGRVRLGDDIRLAELSGVVRIFLETKDGNKWSARWTILPKSFRARAERGVLVVTHDASTRVTALGAEFQRTSAGTDITAPAGAERLDVRLQLPGGELITLPFAVPRRGVQLRLSDGSHVPLTGATITERAILAGACLQVDAGAGARLEVRTHGAETLLHATQRNTSPICVGLDAILDAQKEERTFKLPLDAVVRGDLDDEAAFVVVIPRRCGPMYRVDGDKLVLEFEVDPENLPADPAVAMFPNIAPFDEPALIDCRFEVRGNRAVATIEGRRLPTTRGAYSVGLVDRAGDDLRAISGCGRVTLPLGVPLPVAPPRLSELEAALWDGSVTRIGQALATVVERPDSVAWIDRFVYAARARHGFGLWLFLFYEAVIGEAPWLFFAAAARMPRAEWIEWFSLWSAEPGFTWLRLRERDVGCLRRAIPDHVSDDDRMAMLVAAERVRPMPSAIRYLLQGGLFRSPSREMLASVRDSELAVPSATRLPRDWRYFALPTPDRGGLWRWVRGVDIDEDQRKRVDEFLDGQLLRGQRPRALREAVHFRMRWRGNENPFSMHKPTWPAPPWASALFAKQSAEWDAAAIPAGLEFAPMRDVRQLDRDALEMSILLTVWRDGGSLIPPKLLFETVLRFERLAPELLGAWLAAVQYVERN